MKIEDVIISNNVDALLITNLNNIYYLSLFDGTTATLLHTKEEKYIFVDSRYYEQAKKQTDGYIVILIKFNNLYDILNNIIIEKNIKILGFENQINYSEYEILFNKLNVQQKAISLKNIREIKNESEISIIKKACEITDRAFEHILKFIKVGLSENDINVELQKFILDNNATGLAFKTIVASGVRSSLPHGVATNKLIENNDFITIDFGIIYNGYCSDITRTFAIGNNLNDKLVEIYNVVKEAQQLAINAIKPGVKAKDIDFIARNFIEKAGYKEYFNHGLGHGIGLDIHEEPYINSSSNSILEENHIITIEPGIYIPGLGGVRIEDDILVTKDGCISLTKADKNLIILKGE